MRSAAVAGGQGESFCDGDQGPKIASGKFVFARKYLTLILMIICLIVLSVFWGFGYNAGNLIRDQLLQQGRAFVQEIVLTREWAASYGGVYVQMRPGTEVNPYLLKLPGVKPVITDSDGKRYTLKNPALMTREISDLTVKNGIIKFKITSLDPLNPANAPDSFERDALTCFLKGDKEYWTYEHRGGEVHYRYAAPLRTQQSCLHCHAAQSNRPGGIRGAISVTIPRYGHAAETPEEPDSPGRLRLGDPGADIRHLPFHIGGAYPAAEDGGNKTGGDGQP